MSVATAPLRDVERLDALRARLSTGGTPGDLTGLPPRVVRAVGLATEVGAPALPALDAATAALDDVRDRERATAAATAQARSVALALALLPAVAVPGLGALLDEPLLTFYATPSGRTVAALAGVLCLLGLAVAHQMVSRSLRGGPDAGTDELYDLVAIALGAGLGAGAAVRAAAEAVPTEAPELRRLALALELGTTADPRPALAPLVGLLEVAATYGAPAAPTLRRLADDLRADERARVDAAAQRLPALLTFPTVLFLLPASLLLVGAPVLARGLEAVTAGT